jgi:hypothetical protein
VNLLEPVCLEGPLQIAHACAAGAIATNRTRLLANGQARGGPGVGGGNAQQAVKLCGTARRTLRLCSASDEHLKFPLTRWTRVFVYWHRDLRS